ncbi:TPA: hypothetical protein ACPZN0_004043 [Yersinia enterocolitica]|uniref:hypothetical protein n=1 Tax=Yersinia TaxID=629 RepID=UPI00119ED5D5|nr:hypothetical protein [Yersinia alsatica]EKN3986541.1 hypothetical protein [Yersinia enterocolitica]
MTVINFPEQKTHVIERQTNQELDFIASLMLDISHFAECALDNTYGFEGYQEHELEFIRNALSEITGTASSVRKRILGV